jgi:hypothetical protein
MSRALKVAAVALLASAASARAQPTEQLNCPRSCGRAYEYCLQFRAKDKSNFDCKEQLTICMGNGEWHGPHATCAGLARK